MQEPSIQYYQKVDTWGHEQILQDQIAEIKDYIDQKQRIILKAIKTVESTALQKGI